MSTRAPTAILPRDLQSVPPPVALVGRKAHALAQLLALKARVPRFGILTVDAFDAHVAEPAVARALADAQERGFSDEADRSALGETLARTTLRSPLPVAVRIAISELVGAFAAEDVLVARASIVGEPVEVTALAGALDAVLGVRGTDALEDAVQRLFSLAYHPRTLKLRHEAGQDPLGCRIAIIVQRMILSETSGVCISLETALKDTAERSPRALIRSTWGLAGGIGGKHGSPRIPCDLFRVERPSLAAEGIEDDVRVTSELGKKSDALRYDEASQKGTRMQPVVEHNKKEPSLSVVQARMVAREALRIEAAFGKPQVVSFAFAGRLLHVLDTEALLVPAARIESTRLRTWDERLLPAGLPEKVGTLSFSLWQRAGARGVERAGRILGVKGILLEEVRPQLPRLFGLIAGRAYGNLEVLSALADLLPFADKARAALAHATGLHDLIPRQAPPPGFWQRQRQKLDDGRWPAQLEKIAETTAEMGGLLSREARASLDKARERALGTLDPDSLLDTFDELEDALSKAVAATAMAGLCAMLHRVELEAALDETDLKRAPGLVNDLLGGHVPSELGIGTRRVLELVSVARRRPLLFALLREHKGREEALAQKLGLIEGQTGIDDGDVRWLAEEILMIARAPQASCVSELTLERPRLHEKPDPLVELCCRLVDTDVAPETFDELERAAIGRRKKAEYLAEQAFSAMGALKGPAQKKRVEKLLAEVRKHGADAAIGFVSWEEIVAQLRPAALALGERFFEHGLLDQPRDVFSLEVPEIAGIVRGTGVDADLRPLVSARKRAAVADPTGLPRRIETRGLVATSLVSNEHDDDFEPIATSPGDAKDLKGRSASTGELRERATALDRSPLSADGPGTPRGVLVTRVALLRDLPLMLAGRAVIAERGTLYGPTVFVLRALGVPTIVDVPHATGVLLDGAVVRLDAGRGLVRRVGQEDESAARDLVDPAVFARESVVSDPRQRIKANRPAATFDEIPAPPLVRPASTMDSFVMPPSAPAPRPEDVARSMDGAAAASSERMREDEHNPVHEETDINESDILAVSTDAESEPDR